METAMKPILLESSSGSLVSSAIVHLLVCGGVVALMNITPVATLPPAAEMEVGYEYLTAPPDPVKEVRRMVRAPEPEMVQTKTPTPVAAQELQDTKSDTVGTQAAAAVSPSNGSEGTGSAVDVPYYKIKPKYPRAALVAGEEGWILLKVDVTESGEVENVRIVDGIKRNLFQDEARRAVEKWKYRPIMNGSGKAVRKSDHLVRVDFKLTDA